MKFKNKISKLLSFRHSKYSPNMKSVLFAMILFIGSHSVALAQEPQYEKPSWFFGVAVGSNLNFFRGTTQQLNNELTVPTAFHNGFGAGLYVAPMLEYHKPKTAWGFMLQAGWDRRVGQFNRVINACNCPADLSTNLSYITIEPSIRLAPFKGNFYIYGGPRVAFNLENNFTYKLGVNPDNPNQQPNANVDGEFSETKKTILSMQIGAGYDIPIGSQTSKTQFVLSPFVTFHPYFGQNPRSIESWSMSTVRVGFALKIGQGKRMDSNTTSPYNFTINSPDNSNDAAGVRETFPLRNYVFFDLGSTEIPTRYVLLEKNQVKDFKEDQLEMFPPKNLSGRSDRGMTVYYNILNILGDRMQKNPSSTITLVGSSEKGPEDGKLMAQSIKTYLTNVFSIASSRISIEGRNKPKIPSEQPGGTLELELLREGDRRVSIESNSNDLLMEFQTGPNTPLKPVEIVTSDEAPLSSYLTLDLNGAKTSFTSWSVEVKDEKGKVQNFGPYTEEKVSIPGKAILGTRPEGNYTITMVGTKPDGSLIKEEQTAHLVLWKPSTKEKSMRFSVIYEFNNSDAIAIYDKYLSEVVAPKIPKNGNVIINGFTDIIGDAENNRTLSLARANDVKQILQNSLNKMGRKDVTFVINGNGENSNLTPFNNSLPEERFYNRTVIIDILPAQ